MKNLKNCSTLVVALHFHPAWCNIDLVSHDPNVLEHDLTQGIPFDDGSYDAVYHSHVLEHLEPAEAKKMLTECCRVLRPGGVLRVAVPDLEQITRLYLEKLVAAEAGNAEAHHQYEWMKLELLDQLVRSQSGGMMGPVLASGDHPAHSFIRSRLGAEVDTATNLPAIDKPKLSKLTRVLTKLKKKLADKLIKSVYGENALATLEEARFRNSGEIHRWMYDRHSLKFLIHECGFQDAQVYSATESNIPDYADFQLDHLGTQIRKPDSLFVEAIKPKLANALVA